MTDSVSYVYAVGREVPVGSLDDLTGVAGREVAAVAGSGLQALVSTVPLEDFSGEKLEERLQDLTWLAETARAHHHVVDTVGRAAALVPLALATVFYDEARVRAVLEERGAEFTRALDDLDGRAEFGVKVYLPTGAAPGAGEKGTAEKGTGEKGAGRTTGTEYLRRRRAAVGAAERAMRSARESADALHDVASEAAVRSRRHRVHDTALTGRTDQMVLNGAYLVDRARSGEWRAAVDRAAPGEVTVEITGPWIPYSFVNGEDG
ncbi:GvpL/GvpF family gas vesicle protein [Pseudonocardia sp. KRD291]|uniref:GvpL/GvpF family gas vesicle protein n=1 Tax=Pseudonocardia sp. KRD291 TaxID=2792007 RepID=UPI0027E3B027|nr:GvpL/GvpF family gas vesicle protein [Pseudonocardia sp. KRD291]